MTIHKVWESRNIITSKDQQTIIFTKLAYTTDKTKLLVKFVCGRAQKSLFLDPSWVPGFDGYTQTMVGLSKKALFDWPIKLKEIWNTLLVIQWELWGTKTKILALISKMIYTRVGLQVHLYACDTGHTKQTCLCTLMSFSVGSDPVVYQPRKSRFLNTWWTMKIINKQIHKWVTPIEFNPLTHQLFRIACVDQHPLCCLWRHKR